jgi:hypothetical protein
MWNFSDLTGKDHCERIPQLRRHDFDVQGFVADRFPPIHLAVETIEIAQLVRIQIHTDRQAPGAGGDDGVNKAIAGELPGPPESARGSVKLVHKQRGFVNQAVRFHAFESVYDWFDWRSNIIS